MKKIVLTIVTAVIAFTQYAAAGESVLNVSFTQKSNTQRSGAIIEVQEDNKPALLFGDVYKNQSMMFFWLKKEQCEGKKLKISIRAKGIGLSRNFVFGLQAKKDGKNIWPGGAGQSGTFDWKTFSFTTDFATLGINSAAIRIGLQNAKGKVLFRDLKVEVVDN